MKPLSSTISRGLVIAFVAVSFAACDSGPSAVDETEASYSVAQLTNALGSELRLSTVQLQSVQETASRFGTGDAREPGYLWYLAGELSETLSPEQLQRMLAHAAEIAQQMRQQGMAGPFGPYPEGFGAFGFHGRRPGLGELGAGPGFGQGLDGAPLRLVLTEEEWDALRALRLEYMDEIRSLCDAIRTAPDRAEAIAALETALGELQDTIDAWLAENLDADRLAQIEQFRQEREARRIANREAVRAAIDAVLGEGVANELQAIHDAFVAEVDAAREAYERGSETFREAIRTAATNRDEAIHALLDDEQFLIFRIHQALLIRAHNLSGFGPGHQFRDGEGAGGNQGDCMQDCDGSQTQQQEGPGGTSGGDGGYQMHGG